MSSHARFEAVKAFVSTRGGFDHLADHAEDHGIAGLTDYVEEDVYAAMREVADRRGATMQDTGERAIVNYVRRAAPRNKSD